MTRAQKAAATRSAEDLPRVSETTIDILRAITSLPAGSERERQVESFIRARLRVFRRQARSLCRVNSVPVAKWGEDVEAIVAEAAWDLISRMINDPDALSSVITWEAILFRHARVRVRSFIDHAVSPASGMVTAHRRHRETERSRSVLRSELGREPSDEEIVATTNARVAALPNAAYQGRTVTSADLSVPGPAAELDEELAGETHVDFAEDYVIHPAEGRQFVADVIQAALEHDPDTGRVASLWMGDVYASGGLPEGTDTITHICRQLGLTRAKVRDHIASIRILGIELLYEIGVEGV